MASKPNAPERRISLVVNGEEIEADVEPRLKLSDFLRHKADRTDVRIGCEQGACGACTVELDGRPVKACMLYAVQADESEIVTATGLNDDSGLGPIQDAFRENHGLQCGFCTNGFIVATKSLLEDNPDPEDEEIEEALEGNICRCTGYVNIIDSVKQAADQIDARDEQPGNISSSVDH